jgi:NAD(P)-dependent dehydrogenase (short-subunit alcohol dehydrogenase family)
MTMSQDLRAFARAFAAEGATVIVPAPDKEAAES